MSKDEGLLIVNDDNRNVKPKSLINAISEIEQFSVAEMHSEIPEGSLPIATSLSFFEVGLKSGLLSGIITTVMTPLMMAASERLIPVFGEQELTLFNRLFSIALAVAFPVCYALFIFVILTKSYAGNITKKAINNLVGGISFGTVLKTIVVCLLFHFMYFRFLDPDIVTDVLVKIRNIYDVPQLNYEAIYYWIMGFKKVFIPSAYFIAAVNALFIGIVVSALFIGRYKTRIRNQFLKEWD
jgi:hypothetical protein